MKIVLTHNYFNPIGGAEVFYHEVGRVLEENGHEVAYFSPDDENIISPWKKYFPKTADYKNSGIIQGIVHIKDMIYSNKVKENFEKLLDDFKPDLVHVFAIYVRLTPSILDACTEHHIPVIMSCNDYKHICPNYKLFQHGHLCEACKGGKFYNAVLNKCSKDSIKYSVASAMEAYVHNFTDVYRKNIHTFLFASEFMAAKTEEFWGKETFRWDLLKNPFESQKYPLVKEYNDYILYFGRLIDEKGVDILIRAMKLAPDAKLKIVGNGPDGDMLMELVQNLHLENVEFLGPKWGSDLDDILKFARFIVIPSKWHENFPYVILQSFAYGKAVVGTDRGGIPELVKNNQFGLVYPADDFEVLAEKIRYLWDNPDLAVSMGISAKEYMDKNFNDEKFYATILRIYDKVLT
ncbi:glycosyltransferase family 4 protein [Patescibacteria group bacterium]|nr:glycosyltransferase family 4 protein [Patescibacteria group bacterium]